MSQPCPNCFVITTAAEPTRESLYYLCLSLKTGQYFSYYLKGSVIPFICISDAKKVINEALQNNQEQQWKTKVTADNDFVIWGIVTTVIKNV